MKGDKPASRNGPAIQAKSLGKMGSVARPICLPHRGADRAAFTAMLTMYAKLNDVDPQARLAEGLSRIADMPVMRSFRSVSDRAA